MLLYPVGVLHTSVLRTDDRVLVVTWRLYYHEIGHSTLADGDPLVVRSADVLARARARWRQEGLPFLLSPEGLPDRRVNAWFSSAEIRLLKPLTWKKYGTCLRMWLNFLEQVDAAWDDATPELVEDFTVWRLTDPRNSRRVEPGTVHTDLVVLKQFYAWAAREYGLASPVLMRTLYVQGVGRVEKVAAAPSAVRNSAVKWFEPDGYVRYRDLGLLGLTVDGLDDPSWRGRNPQRDAAFADGLYGTGLRLTEWGSVLDIELPEDDPSRSYRTCTLAAETAKGGRSRRYWMPRSALLDVLSYLEGERAAAVARAQSAGRYGRLPDVRTVTRVLKRRRVRYVTAGGKEELSLDALTPAARRRLFRMTDQGLEPLAVWLNEDGMPRAPHGWHHTFDTVNRRLAQMGLAGFAGSPHMLRHSFALRWYAVGRMLYSKRVGHLTEAETKDFRQEFGSTWLLVQTLLGHQNPQTTMNVYLEPFQSLEVELLLAHVEGVGASALMSELFASDPRVLGDPLTAASKLGLPNEEVGT